jgi:competence protein ComEC
LFHTSQIPFVKICIPFIIGILISQFLPAKGLSIAFFGTFLTLCVVSVFVSFFIKTYKHRFLFGSVLLVILCFLGFSFHRIYNFRSAPQTIDLDNVSLWYGEVVDVLKSDSTKSQFVINISTKESAKVSVIVFAKGNHSKIELGDLVTFSAKLQLIPNNTIPNQFNYSNFLSNRRIYYQLFVTEFIKFGELHSLLRYSNQLRSKVVEIYKELHFTEKNLSVLVALTLGDKTMLDLETKSDFALAGAMHILAVSGLHVGIVFLIFNYLLSFLGERKFARITRAILLLLIIWSFGMLTGLSPSVQRAGCMFSIIILANALNRDTHILNSIFSSAFLLLLINPNNLFEVGFQLSYAAVLGIVTIHPVLYKPLITNNKWINKVSSLLIVSVAAQIATLPFTLFYFHQFPNWFLLVNLLVIPIAFALVLLAILLVFIYLIFSNSFGINYLMEILLNILNFSVSKIKMLPYSHSSDIWIGIESALLIGIVIVWAIYWLYYPSVRLLYRVLILLSILAILEINENVEQYAQSKILVYPINNDLTVIVHGRQAELLLLGDTISNFNKLQVLNHLTSIGVNKYIWLRKFDEVQYKNSFYGQNYNCLFSERGSVLLINEKENITSKIIMTDRMATEDLKNFFNNNEEWIEDSVYSSSVFNYNKKMGFVEL